MKTIGFVDYYISEWHANNYPAWFKEVNEKMGKDFVVKYAWAEEDVSPVDGRTTDEWCKEYGVEKCNTLQELCEKADYICVLSPSNPEKHLQYVKEVFKYKKNTYVDKTFAPDYKTAKEIFDIAEKYGTKFFSSSALRYVDELNPYIGNAAVISTCGGGGSVEEYIVHQAEMVVKVMQSGAQRVRVENLNGHYFVRVQFTEGREASMFFASCLDFNFAVMRKNSEWSETSEIKSATFKNLLSDILRFYEEGTTSFDVNQTLEVMKIREGVLKGVSNLDQWIEL